MKIASRQGWVHNGVRSLCGRIFYYQSGGKENEKNDNQVIVNSNLRYAVDITVFL